VNDEKWARDILAAWVAENPDVPATPPRAQVDLVKRLGAALADERWKARAETARAIVAVLREAADAHEKIGNRFINLFARDTSSVIARTLRAQAAAIESGTSR
jgi:acyl-CoA reductase-like NAD-dependent aldehyde dehydrogenase